MKKKMKRILSLLLAATLTFCAAFTCAAESETGDSFTTNDTLLEWFIVTHDDDPCTFFIIQNDTLFGMSPDARFTVYTIDWETEQPEEASAGGAEQWTSGSFKDADGAEHMVWTLPDMPCDAQYLRFEAGAFTDKAGDPSPEMCAKCAFNVFAVKSSYYDTALKKVLLTQTDADLIEGEAIRYPQDNKRLPASFFSVKIEDEEGVTFATPEYNDEDELLIPAKAGTAEYTFMVCGQEVGPSEAVKALTRTEYEALCKKDRPKRIMLGIALIPTLPLFMLGGGVYGGLLTAGMSLVFLPSIVALPVTAPIGSVLYFGEGAVYWWKAVTMLIFGAD